MMKRRYFLLGLGVMSLELVGSRAWAQDPWAASATPPRGVRYNPLSSQQMLRVAKQVEQILAPDYAGNETLCDSILICLPGLWKSWSSLPAETGVESIPATFKPGGEGRLFKAQTPLKQLDRRLRETLAQDGGFKLRRPNAQELARFWAIIDFDITDPMLMLESKQRTLMLYFQNGKLRWLDDYSPK